MSSALTNTRRDLRDLLTEALTGAQVDGAVLDHVPEELAPPCLVIDADDDYLTPGETFDGEDWWLTLRVYALVNLNANEAAIEDLEALLSVTLPALTAAGQWAVVDVSRPGPFSTSQWLAHGVAVTVRTVLTLP